MGLKFVLITIFLQMTVSIAYPGECTTKSIQMWVAKMRFKYNSVGGAEQILLDNFYMEYFSAQTENLQKELAQKIAIFTHIYLLNCKIKQNRKELEEIFVANEKKERGAAEKKSGTKKEAVTTIYKQFNLKMADILQSAWQNADDTTLCRLLGLKHEIFKQLRFKMFGHATKKPNCADSSLVTQTLSANREQIAEWILSDLLHFLPERNRLIKYFREISKRNDVQEIRGKWKRFSDLIGTQRAIMLWALYNDQIGFMAPRNSFYPTIYNEFLSNGSVLAKWRSKLVLASGLYNEWAFQFFDNERAKIVTEKEYYKGTKYDELKMKTDFLEGLIEDWRSYQVAFWHREKMIVENVIFFIKKENQNKFGQLKQIIADVHELESGGCGMDNSAMMLWEDAPDKNGILIFHSLTICIKRAVAEYDAKFLNTKSDNLANLAQKTNKNFLKCIAREASKHSHRQLDEFLAKLHYDKIAQFIMDDEGVMGEQITKMLTDKKQLLYELMLSDEIAKLSKLYEQKNNYFSTHENFCSSDEENFYDSIGDDKIKYETKVIAVGKGNDKQLEEALTEEKKDKNFEVSEKKSSKNMDGNSEEINFKSTDEMSELNSEPNESEQNYNLLSSGKNSEISERNSDEIFGTKLEISDLNMEANIWTAHSQYKKHKSKKFKKIFKMDRADGILVPKNEIKIEWKNCTKKGAEKLLLPINLDTADEQRNNATNVVEEKKTKCQIMPKNMPILGKDKAAAKEEEKQQMAKGSASSSSSSSSKHWKLNTAKKHYTQKQKASDENKAVVEVEAEAVSYANECTMFLANLGIHKFINLFENLLIANLYKIYYENGLMSKDCAAQYLVISVFARAIQAKIEFINFCHKEYMQKDVKQFEEKWTNFVGTELDKFDGTEFLSEKLFFVLNELDEFAFEPSKNICIEKAIKYMDEPQITQTVNKSIENDEIIDKRKGLPSTNNQMPSSTEIVPKMSQFGAYKNEQYNELLSLLHTQMLFIMKAKNEMEKWQNEWWHNFQIGAIYNQNFFLTNYPNFLRGYLMFMQRMLQMQYLDGKYFLKFNKEPIKYETFQFNFIRCNQKNRDEKMSTELTSLISSQRFNLSTLRAILNLRRQIKEIVIKWSEKQNLKNIRLVTNGSHLLNADLRGSDMDLLCFASNKINYVKFYGDEDDTLLSMLKKEFLLSKASIFAISGRVNLIQIKHALANIDLAFVPIPEKFLLSNNYNYHADAIMQEMNFESGIYSLAGFRSSKYLLAIVPDSSIFSWLLISVKLWAKNREIDSGIFGFLNGAALSVMAAKICIAYPNAPLIYLLQQFYAIYSKWDWPNVPVLLDELTVSPLNEFARFWPPKIATNSMTVITPTFPEQNATFNVNKFTQKTIVAEFQIAHQILSGNVKNWQLIFQPNVYENIFGHFAIIICSSAVLDVYNANCGFQKSKIRQYLMKWAERAEVAEKLKDYHAISSFERKGICFDKPSYLAQISSLCTLWLVGLTARDGFKENFIDNLLPIYRHDPTQIQNDVLRIESIFTDSKNLSNTIVDLEATKTKDNKAKFNE